MFKIPLIYFINMEKSKNRLDHMKKNLNKYGLSYKRINAIDGLNRSEIINYLFDPYIIKLIDHNKSILNGKTRDHRIKEIACILSHLKAIRTAYDDDLEYVIITEDDVNFDDFLKKESEFLNAIQSLPNDWDIVQITSTNQKVIKQLGQKYKRRIDFISRVHHNDYKKWKTDGFWSNGAYLLNRKGMEKIVTNEFKNNRVNLEDTTNIFEADHYIYKHLNAYTLTGIFITLKLFQSTIGEKHMFEAIDSNLFSFF